MNVLANMYPISPVVYINVLDPARHKKALAESTYSVTDLQATVDKPDVIRTGLVVKYTQTVEETTTDVTAEEGVDYTLGFDSDGYLVVTLISGRPIATSASIKVSGYQGWDPTDPDPNNPWYRGN